MGSIANVKGIRLGHISDYDGVTGISVVLCEDGAVGSAVVVGGAPGTRETDLLKPSFTVSEIHGLFLAGGSAFGLNAAEGIVRYLEEKGIGFDTQVCKVPIVPGAVIFDLGVGDPNSRPTSEMAYAACLDAGGDFSLSGNVGVGVGATVGKLYGPQYMMKSGLGNGAVRLGKGITVGCVIVVNAVGDVHDPGTGRILAGAYDRQKRRFLGCPEGIRGSSGLTGRNTTIGVVATDASLTKEECQRVAIMAVGGIAQTVRPAFTPFDGDTVFVLSTGKAGRKRISADCGLRSPFVTQIGIAAQEAVVRAVMDSVISCKGLAGVPARIDLGL